MNYKAWNVHRTNPDHLQKLLNDHAAKGYRLHSWLRDGGNLYAIFRNEQTEEMMIQAARMARQEWRKELKDAWEKVTSEIVVPTASQVAIAPSPQPATSPSPRPVAAEQPATAHEDFLVGASGR